MGPQSHGSSAFPGKDSRVTDSSWGRVSILMENCPYVITVDAVWLQIERNECSAGHRIRIESHVRLAIA